jgi:aspartate aminotransferase
VEEADAAVSAMVRAFHARRDAVLEALGPLRSRAVHPAGAFYLYIDVSHLGGTDPGATCAARLLEEQQVAVVPGSGFGTPSWIRASYATSEALAVEGVQRLARLLQGA